MLEVRQTRAWSEIAHELMEESNPERIFQLSQELTCALQSVKYETASVPFSSKLVQPKRAN